MRGKVGDGGPSSVYVLFDRTCGGPGPGGDRRQGDRGTNIVDTSCCRVPGYPCPQILAVGISHHGGGGSGSRSPPCLHQNERWGVKIVLHNHFKDTLVTLMLYRFIMVS